MRQQKIKSELRGALIFFALFLVLLVAVKTIDVQAIGPQNTTIGLAGLNRAVNKAFGTHLFWYKATELFGVIAILVAAGFALLGLYQLVKGKSLKAVDKDLFVLGGLFAAVIVCYVFFEIVIINYRPVILDAEPEASFPSSHTMVVFCILFAAIEQFKRRIPNRNAAIVINSVCLALIVLTVIGRLICGVHWFTDIVAGLLLGNALLKVYMAGIDYTLGFQDKSRRNRS